MTSSLESMRRNQLHFEGKRCEEYPYVFHGLASI
jgi:hypothetical protein